MELSSLLAKTKKITVPFPGMQGFSVDIVYLSKEESKRIREKSKNISFDQKTHQPVEGIDDDLFTSLYVKKALTGWTGFKYEYLKELILVDEDALPEEGELPYTENNGLMLVNNSTNFDSWLSSVMSDISLFNKGS